jgi:hypothetical protein
LGSRLLALDKPGELCVAAKCLLHCVADTRRHRVLGTERLQFNDYLARLDISFG